MAPPVKPDESDCCNSGCNPCILDVYEELLNRYQNSQIENEKFTYVNCMKTASYTYFKLVSIEEHTHSTFMYTFEYLKPYRGEVCERSKAELKVLHNPGQHFLLRGLGSKDDKNLFTRAYTPIPVKTKDGLQFTIVVRLYESGKMSKYLSTLTPGQATLWRGPYGDFTINYNCKHILCIAQGTGIAPIYSVVHTMVENENCSTFIKLFFCCRSCTDIILRKYLYDLTAHWNFSYEVFLSEIENVSVKYNETIHERRLGIDDIRRFTCDRSECDVNILICGSDEFSARMKEYVLTCQVASNNIYVF